MSGVFFFFRVFQNCRTLFVSSVSPFFCILCIEIILITKVSSHSNVGAKRGFCKVEIFNENVVPAY